MDEEAIVGDAARDDRFQPTCRIMGVDLVATRYDAFVKRILDDIEKLKGSYVCFTCAHSIVYAYEDTSYADCQNGGFAAVPDGGSLSTISRRRGYADAERITAPNLMEDLLRASEDHRISHFFYGSTKETLESLRGVIAANYHDVDVVGMYSPPFRELTNAADAEIVDMINSSGADILWVGLGAPKQEVWMSRHKGRVNALMMGVGAGFDYLAGNISRAPVWMQRLNLEWLYRVIEEPRRLAKRYLYAVPRVFLYGYVLGK